MSAELFTVPGLGWTITAYGLGVGAALVSSWFASLVLARRDKLPTESLGTVFVAAAIVGLFTARAAFLVQQEQALTLEALRSLPAGGSAVFGGLVGALATSALGCARLRVPLSAWLDCAAPAVALGAVFERIGAFAVGGDFGRYVAPGDFGHVFGVTYPPGTPPYLLHVSTLQRLPGVSEASSAPIHPVQLYLALTCALAAGLGLWLRGRRRFSGEVALAVLGVFVLGRAVLFEPLRFGASPEVLGPLHLQQVSGLGILAALALCWRLLRAGGRRHWEGGPWSRPA